MLIANRGEIACRIVRTLERMGIASVAVYSDADSGSRHVRLATEAVHIGASPVQQSYLCTERLLGAAKETGAQAVHPGYGLLSENAEFAAACESSGLAFLGPTPGQIAAFGRKETARSLAEQAGVPLCPGSGVLDSVEHPLRKARTLGFPLLLKAAAGGGGIGMQLCRDEAGLATAFETTQRQARDHFGSGDVFLEAFLDRARHVEIQIFGDGRGHVVSLGSRDCSLQRRRQKVVEEAPAYDLAPSLLDRMNASACALARSVDYRSAGTVEFLVDPASEAFYFLEVNTRLQVEHTVTEAITGVDLVEWMVRVAGGDTACIRDYVHAPTGHAIEVRLYAEDPGLDFQPSAGPLTDVELPGDVRVDAWVERGTEVSPFYDPLLGKLVVRAPSRVDAISGMRDALHTARLEGIPTNLEYLRQVLRWAPFREATHDTRSLDEFAYRESALRVDRPGAATTVQEHPGRLGFWSVGVPPSGPMDDLAFQWANRIVGNAGGEAALEIAVEGPTLQFTRSATICVAGAEVEAHVDDVPLALWRAVEVREGACVRIGRITGGGARAYLAVRGGVRVPRHLGSRATFTLGGFGGHCGRSLVAGDVLPLGSPDDPKAAPEAPLGDASAHGVRIDLACRSARSGSSTSRHDPPSSEPGPASRTWVLRVLDGPHGAPEFFTPDDLSTLYSDTYEVHHQSARTGVRLVGPKPTWARPDGGDAGLHPSNIHDTPYAVGSLDFTGDMPVILGPDGPSLGGFVCPAVVVEADLWKLGQLRAGDGVRFLAIDRPEAHELMERRRRCLAQRQPHASGDLALPTDESIEAARRPSGPRSTGVLARHAATDGRPEIVYRSAGERHLLVEFGACTLDLDLRIRVHLLWQKLQQRIAGETLPGITDLTPGVRSLQIQYDPETLPLGRLMHEIEALEPGLPTSDALSLPARVVHLPLSWADPAALEAIEKYSSVVRPDAPWCPSNLEFIRRINGLDTIDDVRRIVFDASYLVLGLGDVYLGAPVATPLDPRHRLVTTKYNPARTWTPENAVGIGGAYLCVYGMEGPGGYQLVGRTVPVWSTYERFRGRGAGRPWLLRFLDQIRFFPVSADELIEWRRGVGEGRIELEIEETHFDLGAYHRFLDKHRTEIDAFRQHQQDAFEAERRRWVEAGEFQRAESLANGPVLEEAAPIPEGAQLLTAPMGAQIWSVSVEPGQEVAPGDPLVVLSAMKTETAVVAPEHAVVEAVLCRSGQVVSTGTPLVALRNRVALEEA